MRVIGGNSMLRSFRLDSRFNEKLINIAIVVVAIMLVVCIVLLIFVLGGKGNIPTSSNNVIGTKGDDIKLGNEGDVEQVKFDVSNMFPGDSEVKTFTVVVTNKKINKINFKAELVTENEAFYDVMRISVKVRDENHPIYTGLIKDLEDGIKVDMVSGEETEFTITVTLDPSAGNECQNSEVAVNFAWWIASLGYVQ